MNDHELRVNEYANHDPLTIIRIPVVVNENECVSFVSSILAICGSQLESENNAIPAMYVSQLNKTDILINPPLICHKQPADIRPVTVSLVVLAWINWVSVGFDIGIDKLLENSPGAEVFCVFQYAEIFNA